MRSLIVALALLIAVPASAETGIASFYTNPQMTANCHRGKCERFNPNAKTCAHKTLPMGTMVKVTAGSRSTVCRVNDRGPYVAGRVIDLSRAGARELGIVDRGLARVTLQRWPTWW